ncbi:hypothetical protein CLAFUW4_02573 [Fulvia fulva]|uniref:Uncharacterized protein n=1 Tax=Passalora fulva TaxID=5499 RepID=A0A9Q8P5R3_PASFU|nr:uncharacterized protein CLAFUR5_02562 [Fulvia fulva]KAK4631508.1 hypothetical protein CLAFUR4_02568 [Fulvia fulva]UJO14176.1 hypothetical protein CLAFUR5_02562 [Fulvia fulva]WPV11833.1 hypothetical protein CLAFUW4_02573 [Fulvia fulva]WPV26004.1 hypothetical protein CLAFUW7_02573 [Fulvia fulva]
MPHDLRTGVEEDHSNRITESDTSAEQRIQLSDERSINHDDHDINGLTKGVEYARTTTSTVLHSNELPSNWNAPDGLGGCTVHKTVFTNTDKTSGKAITKTSLVTTTVKATDGKRKVAELVEVEVEQ